jgi:hypothetical protein
MNTISNLKHGYSPGYYPSELPPFSYVAYHFLEKLQQLLCVGKPFFGFLYH